ncbi:pentapeptide repeat-containing protein [Geodermatophilus sp. URMC 64]
MGWSGLLPWTGGEYRTLVAPVPAVGDPLAAQTIQAWIAAGAAFLTAVLGIFKYFRYRDKRDRLAAVGTFFAATVEGLASDNETKRMAGAVLLRRFFDGQTEQGEAGAPYSREAVEVIAGLLRSEPSERLQKVLADGLRYAVDLRDMDLQHCDLREAYLGRKEGDKRPLDLSRADLFGAVCDRASFKGVTAKKTVFYQSTLLKTVFTDADLEEADFREAQMKGAKFGGARIGKARFAGAHDIPENVARLLDGDQVAPAGSVVHPDP